MADRNIPHAAGPWHRVMTTFVLLATVILDDLPNALYEGSDPSRPGSGAAQR
ncbi:hypothetical protein ACIO3O_25250 [Streptomyces sp. NPDC087440]|uniref:hypothetical protein n=1 Tax=Streptomyces sp. NPDC087440 TaxID=3365790 RepID=UPI0037F66B94